VKSATATVESTTTVTTAATMAPAATVAAAAAMRHLHEAGRTVFPVEQVEGRETDVRHFLFAQDEALGVGRGGQSLRNVGGRKGGRGCASDK
jgi:hypothetical protein